MLKYKALFIGNNPTINEYQCNEHTCINTLTEATIEQDELMEDTPEEAILALKARLRGQITFLKQELKQQTDKPILGRAKTLIRKYEQFLRTLEDYDEIYKKTSNTNP